MTNAQFNFYDHTKLILSDDGLVVSIIDKHYNMHSWTLDALLQPPSSEKDRERHKHEKYITKLEYARSLLARMRAHGGMGATMARVQEKERAREGSAKEAHGRESREMREREERRPIRG